MSKEKLRADIKQLQDVVLSLANMVAALEERLKKIESDSND